MKTVTVYFTNQTELTLSMNPEAVEGFYTLLAEGKHVVYNTNSGSVVILPQNITHIDYR